MEREVERREIWKKSKEIRKSKLEKKIWTYLIAGEWCSAEEIAEYLYREYIGKNEISYVSRTIQRLRKKLQVVGVDIIWKKGKGYQIKLEGIEIENEKDINVKIKRMKRRNRIMDIRIINNDNQIINATKLSIMRRGKSIIGLNNDNEITRIEVYESEEEAENVLERAFIERLVVIGKKGESKRDMLLIDLRKNEKGEKNGESK